jgi:hypothetical protein
MDARRVVIAALMDGFSGEQVAASTGRSIRSVKAWECDFFVAHWRKYPELTALMRTGVFHVTQVEGLRGIISDKKIRPSGELPAVWGNLTEPCLAAALNSVAVFDIPSQCPLTVCPRTNGMMDILKKHAPSVLLKLEVPSGSLLHWLDDEVRAVTGRMSLQHIEAYHRGPIPWTCVTECWTWSKSTPAILRDFTYRLEQPEKLLRLISQPPIKFGPWREVNIG